MSIYSCHSTDPADQRVKSSELLIQDGWRVLRRGEIMTREPVMKVVFTPWINTNCMAMKQIGFIDENCVGCTHRGEEK